ncbi:MAG: hypothetical protein QME51_01215 [Planctomycetota bacterium]|nr:hypothetical protein [Planctomycetota bacterium]
MVQKNIFYITACKIFRNKMILSLIILVSIFNLQNGLTPLIHADPQNERKQKDDLNLIDVLLKESVEKGFNFFDIIEETITEVLKNPASKKIEQQALLTLGKMKKFTGMAEREPEKRVPLIKEATDILDKFIKENQDYVGLSEAKFELAELLQEQARVLSSWYKTEIDPSKKAGLLEQIETIYKKINEYLTSMISDYQKLISQTTDSKKGEELENNLMRASYNRGLSYYYWGIIFDKGDENRKKHLKESIRLLSLFIIEQGDKLSSFDAADYIGICYYELADKLEDYNNTKEYFNSAAKLYDSIKDDPDKTKEEKMEIVEECRDIIQRGYTHLAMVSNVLKEYAQTIKTIDDLIKIFPHPKYQSDEWMERGLLEKAKALFYTNKKEQALSIVQEIKGKSQTSSVRSLANDVLNEFLKKGGGGPEVYLSTMRDLLIKKQFYEVIQQGQDFLNQLKYEADDKKVQYLPEVLFIMAETFKLQGRFYEAIILYESIYFNPQYKEVRSSQKEHIAPLAAYGSAFAYLKMASETGDDADRIKYKEILSYLTKTWPESDQAKEMQFFHGEASEAEGKYMEAVEAYSKVPSASKFYYAALFRIGYMFYLLVDKQTYPSYRAEKDQAKKESIKKEIIRLLTQSEEGFKKSLNLYQQKSQEAIDEESKAKIAHNDLQSRLFLSRVYLNDFIQKYSEVLTVLGKLEEKYRAKPDAVTQIMQLKVESFIKLNDLNSAETHFKSLYDYARKEGNLEIAASVLQLLAFAYEKEANDIIPPVSVSTPEESEKRRKNILVKREKDKENHKKFVDRLEKSGEYFSQWVEIRKKTISPDEVLTVADKLYQIAEDIKNNNFYSKASNFYERILEKEFQVTLPRQETWLVQWKITKCYIALGDNEKAISILEKLDQEKPKNVDIKKQLALAYTASGSMGKIHYWQLGKKKWAELSKLFKEQTEEWWEAKYYFVLMDYNIGNYKEALHSISMIENAISKDFDGNTWGYKTKFLDLKKKIEEKK